MGAGVGHSRLSNAFEAGREAALLALNEANPSEPSIPLSFVVVYGTVLYEQLVLLDGVRSVVGSDVPMVGCSVQGISILGGVFEVDRVVGVAIVAVDGVVAKVAVAHHLGTDSGEAGRGIGSDLGDVGELPILVWYDPLTVNSTALLQGLKEKGISKVIGGGAGQPFGPIHKTYQYHNGEVSEGCVVAMSLSGPIGLTFELTHGSEPVGLEFEVTSAEGNILYTLDGIPAYDVWAKTLDAVGPVLNVGRAAPWALGVKLPDAEALLYEGLLTRAVFGLDPDAGAVILQAAIPTGTLVQLCHRTHEAVMDGALSMAERLKAKINDKPLIALSFECAARPRPFLGDVGALEEVCGMQQILGSFPWLGHYAWGEIAPIGETSYAHNYTFPLVILTVPGVVS